MNRCIQCGATSLEQTHDEHVVMAAGRQFTARVPATKCHKCGEVYVDVDALARVDLAAAKALGDAGEATGETFRFMRRALGFTAVALAEELGTSGETISRWERGERDVDRFAWLALAGLVADRLEGRTSTLDRLRAVKERPGLAKVVRLDVSAVRPLIVAR